MSSSSDTTNSIVASSEMASDTAMATQLLALTTPFKQPRGCESHWERTHVLLTEGDKSTVPVLLSKAVPLCFPSGWEEVVPESRWHFSPAVCPSGWTYYNMGKDAVKGHSTAFCCNSGYTRLNDDNWELVASAGISTHLCGCWVQNTDQQATTSNTKSGSSMSTSQTLMLHEAWSISWHASGTSTLTPKPPSLASNIEVPTWAPGQDIPHSNMKERSSDDDGPLSGEMGKFLLIGLPIIGLFFLSLGVWICLVHYKDKKRAARN